MGYPYVMRKKPNPLDKQAPKKKFKLHRMTKEELLATRIPVYDYLIP